MTADGFRVFNRKVDPISKNFMDKTGNKRILDPTKSFAKPKPKSKRKVLLNQPSQNSNEEKLGSDNRNTSF